MRIPKKSLIALVGAGLAGSANGQSIITDQFINNNGSEYVFGADITNNSGVTFDSGSLDYSQLFLDTANLSWNIGDYDSVANGGDGDGYVTLSEFLPKAKTDGDVFFGLASTGDVYIGWSGNIGNDGVVDLSHIDGIEGFDYDAWNDTETMQTFLGLDNSLYTNPETNTIVPINLDSNATISDFATASEGGISGLNFSADGQGYNIAVPEPSQYAALTGALALGLAAYRRPTRKE